MSKGRIGVLGKMHTQQTRKELERITNELKDEGAIALTKGVKNNDRNEI